MHMGSLGARNRQAHRISASRNEQRAKATGCTAFEHNLSPGDVDRRHARTKQELDELQGDLVSRRYSEQKVGDVINAMQRVVADNRMPPRDREILNQDLQHLRDYREHHGRWGQ